MSRRIASAPWLGALWMCCAAIGCGGGTPSDQPELGNVSGIVTLDGKPLEKAMVAFIPEKGSPSYGTTDADGNYTLSYTADADGAVLGKHSVRITTFREGGEDEEGNSTERVPERVPEKYNTKTELTADVKAGSNTVDLKLDGSGKIVQPPKAD